ncbi:MAG: hypothetical protein R6U98_19305 [Pirellulaceae bacterium]
MHVVRVAYMVLVVVATAGRVFAADASRLEQEFVAARELVARFCHACAKGDPATARGAYDESTPQGTVGAALAARFANDVAEYRDLEDMACDKFGPPGVAAVRSAFRSREFLRRIGIGVESKDSDSRMWEEKTHVFMGSDADTAVAYNEVWKERTFLVRKQNRWYIQPKLPERMRPTEETDSLPDPDSRSLPMDDIARTRKLLGEHDELAGFQKALDKLSPAADS